MNVPVHEKKRKSVLGRLKSKMKTAFQKDKNINSKKKKMSKTKKEEDDERVEWDNTMSLSLKNKELEVWNKELKVHAPETDDDEEEEHDDVSEEEEAVVTTMERFVEAVQDESEEESEEESEKELEEETEKETEKELDEETEKELGEEMEEYAAHEKQDTEVKEEGDPDKEYGRAVASEKNTDMDMDFSAESKNGSFICMEDNGQNNEIKFSETKTFMPNYEEDTEEAYERIKASFAQVREKVELEVNNAAEVSTQAQDTAIIDKEEDVDEDEDEDEDEYDWTAAVVPVFGERVQLSLQSHQWTTRQDGFARMQRTLQEMQSQDVPPSPYMLQVVLHAVNHGIEDRVLPIVYTVLDVLRSAIKAFAPFLDETYAKSSSLSTELSMLTMGLLIKLNERNKRTRKEVKKALLRITRLKLLKPMKRISLQLSLEDIPIRARLLAITVLMDDGGLDTPYSLALRDVMKVAVPGLDDATQKTRLLSITAIASAQILVGKDRVIDQLPPLKASLQTLLQNRMTELLSSKTTLNASSPVHVEVAGSDIDEENDMMMKEEEGKQMFDGAASYNEDNPHLQNMVAEAKLDAENLFGPVLWHRLHSKAWQDRTDALSEMVLLLDSKHETMVTQIPCIGNSIQRDFAAHCVILNDLLSDAVRPVILLTHQVLTHVLTTFATIVDYREENVKTMLIRCILSLTNIMSKSTITKIHQASFHSLLLILRLPNTHCLTSVLLCVSAEETSSFVQMKILKVILVEFGLTRGLTVSYIMTLINAALQASDVPSRQAAKAVIVVLTRLVGRVSIEKQAKSLDKKVRKTIDVCLQLENKDTSNFRPHSVDPKMSTAVLPLPPSVRISSAPLNVLNVKVDLSVTSSRTERCGPPRPPTLMSEEEEAFMNDLFDRPQPLMSAEDEALMSQLFK